MNEDREMLRTIVNATYKIKRWKRRIVCFLCPKLGEAIATLGDWAIKHG